MRVMSEWMRIQLSYSKGGFFNLNAYVQNHHLDKHAVFSM